MQMNDAKSAVIIEQILALEQEATKAKESIMNIENKIKYLKDILWDKDSMQESKLMREVIDGKRESVDIQTNIGNVKVDSEFVKQKATKHFDNPQLRGMITTDEVVSFPKVAKNATPKYNKLHKDYTWKVKADDNSVIRYGSRKYEKDNKQVSRLITTYTETERGERKTTGVGEQSQPRHLINDFDSLRPVSKANPTTNTTKSQIASEAQSKPKIRRV